MKRFTETLKWDDPWFRSLKGVEKLVFLYVIDRCNNAGFWEIDEAGMAFQTKLSEAHIAGAWQGLARGLIVAGGWVWVRRFLRHQKNEKLNPENNAHTQIIALLAEQVERFDNEPEFQKFLAPYQPLISPKLGAQVEVEVQEKVKKGSAEGRIPAIEEAYEYGREIGMNESEVDAWFDHFSSNGWKISGKAPMKDWRAALRNGNRNKGNFAPVLSKKSELLGIRVLQ